MRAVLKAQINKTDRNDARGMAQMMRVGLYRRVHVKTLRSQKLRMLLTHRKLLQSKAIAIDNDLRATLRNFGLKVGMVGTVKFEARIKELVENLPDLAVLVEPRSLSGGCFASRPASCTAAYWPSSGTMMCAGA
jgi:transposase